MTLTLAEVRAKSAAKLAGLLPYVASKTSELIDRCYARGVPIVITQGFRSISEQDALYAQGRTDPGVIVTNARGGSSYHNYGVAIDFALLLPDGRTVSWNTLRDGDKDSLPDWSEVVTEGKALGFAWGGDWRTFKDMPHFEMTGGLTIADFRAGKKPKFAEVKAISSAEVTEPAKEEDDTLQLTAYQWTTVQAKIKALLDAKTINDCSWLDKAEKKTLTASELAWLTFMVAK